MSTALSTRVMMVAAVLCVCVSARLHVEAGLSLPVPWPDEAAFLWPAHALAERGTLLAPELNPDRVVRWMPPGYAVAMGALFVALPFTLETARWVSWGLSALSLLGLLVLHRQRRGAVASAIPLAVVGIAPSWVVMGNVARMEAWVVALATVSACLLTARRWVSGLTLAAVLPLFHPLGLLFSGALGGLGLLGRAGSPPPRRGEWLLAGAAVVAWLGAVLFALSGWSDFIADMSFQFGRKQALSALDDLWQPRVWGPFVAWVAVAAGAFALSMGPRPLSWLAAACLAVRLISNEMWYQVYGDVGLVLVASEALEVLSVGLSRGFAPSRTTLAVSLSVPLLAGAGVLRGLRLLGVTASPRALPNQLEWECMQMRSEPYLSSDEAARVRQVVAAAARATPSRRVFFETPGDGLLLQPDRPGDYVPVFPLFTSTRPDLSVVHLSPHRRGCDHAQFDAALERARVTPPHTTLMTDGAPRWLVFEAAE